ncbi:hypothetical protein E2P81_ATG11896 [Venturia nashicola]|uniref:Uncharacterized protein n=1 Tax=Venturia nashicola TaxID=86259 RepID=A0A4Z1NY75_9PEZI|nr:hypothetical protein E6O75_ATG11587 [Venturia nashicola]TLD24560.1 hypothetical protein E2P81_ATG11896 [Venturia nashicola]
MELPSRSRRVQRSLLQPILLVLTTLAPTFAAQSTAQTQPAPTTFFTVPSTTNATAAATTSAYRPQGSDNAPNTLQNPNAGNNVPSSDQDDSDDPRSGLLNYYFVFLALFICLLVMGIYFLHKRQRARKQAFRNSGENALARDLDGWTGGPRRWIVGHRREESRNTSGSREEEGLNEFGEAPPPYIQATKTPNEQERVEEGSQTQVQIPLNTLSRHESERSATGKPPEYGEVVEEQSSGTMRDGSTASATSNNVAPRP